MRECRYNSTVLDLGIKWEWSASRPDRFSLGIEPLVPNWLLGWVGPRAGVGAIGKRKISCPCRESNLDLPVRSIVAAVTELSWISNNDAI
jgi:hypothetical protein